MGIEQDPIEKLPEAPEEKKLPEAAGEVKPETAPPKVEEANENKIEYPNDPAAKTPEVIDSANETAATEPTAEAPAEEKKPGFWEKLFGKKEEEEK